MLVYSQLKYIRILYLDPLKQKRNKNNKNNQNKHNKEEDFPIFQHSMRNEKFHNHSTVPDGTSQQQNEKTNYETESIFSTVLCLFDSNTTVQTVIELLREMINSILKRIQLSEEKHQQQQEQEKQQHQQQQQILQKENEQISEQPKMSKQASQTNIPLVKQSSQISIPQIEMNEKTNYEIQPSFLSRTNSFLSSSPTHSSSSFLSRTNTIENTNINAINTNTNTNMNNPNKISPTKTITTNTTNTPEISEQSNNNKMYSNLDFYGLFAHHKWHSNNEKSNLSVPLVSSGGSWLSHTKALDFYGMGQK
jgi:hypothetical protein